MKKNKVEILLAIIFAIVFVIGFTSCSTQKSGCGDYSKWEAKTKFRGGN